MIRTIWLALITLTLLFVMGTARLENSMQFKRFKRNNIEKYPQFPVKATLTYILPGQDEVTRELVCPEGSESNGKVCLEMQEPDK